MAETSLRPRSFNFGFKTITYNIPPAHYCYQAKVYIAVHSEAEALSSPPTLPFDFKCATSVTGHITKNFGFPKIPKLRWGMPQKERAREVKVKVKVDLY